MGPERGGFVSTVSQEIESATRQSKKKKDCVDVGFFIYE